MTTVINQYLKTASGGNVNAEFALVDYRWRLKCTRCQQTLTFSETYSLEEAYVKEGRLDSAIQNFAKDHRHEKPWNYDPENGGSVPTFTEVFDPVVKKPLIAYEPQTYDSQKQAEQKDEAAATLQAYKNAAKIKLAQLNALIAQQKARVDELEKSKEVPAPTPKPIREGRRFR